MTQDELNRITETAGYMTAPSGRPVVVMGRNDFDALIGAVTNLRAFATEITEAGYVEGLSDKTIVDMARARGIVDPEVGP